MEKVVKRPKTVLLDLPNELLLRVVQGLPTKDIHGSCKGVNRRLRAIVNEHFLTVDHLQFRISDGRYGTANTLDHPSKLLAFCLECQPNIRALSTFTFVDPSLDESIVQDLIDCLDNLSTLKALALTFLPSMASDLDKIRTTWKHHLVNLEYLSLLEIPTWLYKTLDSCDSLKTLHLSDFRNPLVFKIGQNPPVRYQATTLHMASMSEQLRQWQLETCLTDILEHFPKLEVLAIDSFWDVSKDLYDLLKEISEVCPNIESLSLSLRYTSRSKILGPLSFSAGQKLLPNLKKFKIKVKFVYKVLIHSFLEDMQKWPIFDNASWKSFKVKAKQSQAGTGSRSGKEEYFQIASDPMPSKLKYRADIFTPTPDWVYDKVFGSKDGQKCAEGKGTDPDTDTDEESGKELRLEDYEFEDVINVKEQEESEEDYSKYDSTGSEGQSDTDNDSTEEYDEIDLDDSDGETQEPKKRKLS